MKKLFLFLIAISAIVNVSAHEAETLPAGPTISVDLENEKFSITPGEHSQRYAFYVGPEQKFSYSEMQRLVYNELLDTIPYMGYSRYYGTLENAYLRWYSDERNVGPWLIACVGYNLKDEFTTEVSMYQFFYMGRIYVQGVVVTQDNADDILKDGHWSYDYANSVLHMKDVDCEVSDGKSLIAVSNEDDSKFQLYVYIEGKNRVILNDGYFIRTSNPVVIDGQAGSLFASSTDNPLIIDKYADLQPADISIVYAQDMHLTSTNNYAIKLREGSLNIFKSDLILEGKRGVVSANKCDWQNCEILEEGVRFYPEEGFEGEHACRRVTFFTRKPTLEEMIGELKPFPVYKDTIVLDIEKVLPLLEGLYSGQTRIPRGEFYEYHSVAITSDYQMNYTIQYGENEEEFHYSLLDKKVYLPGDGTIQLSVYESKSNEKNALTFEYWNGVVDKITLSRPETGEFVNLYREKGITTYPRSMGNVNRAGVNYDLQVELGDEPGTQEYTATVTGIDSETPVEEIPVKVKGDDGKYYIVRRIGDGKNSILPNSAKLYLPATIQQIKSHSLYTSKHELNIVSFSPNAAIEEDFVMSETSVLLSAPKNAIEDFYTNFLEENPFLSELNISLDSYKVEQVENSNVATISAGMYGATVTWPTSASAVFYEISIKFLGMEVVYAKVSSTGELVEFENRLGISIPGLDELISEYTGATQPSKVSARTIRRAPASTGSGMSILLPGLLPDIDYTLQISAIQSDNTDVEITESPVSFATDPEDGEKTAIDPVSDNSAVRSSARKLLFDGQLLILRDGKTYNAQGAQVK